MIMGKKLSRRRVLRGILQGGAVSVALPLLNCFLNENGQAFASGTALPVRFGTWSWGLGMTKAIFQPTKFGPDYDLPEEIAALAPVRKHLNLYSNFNVPTDGRPSLCHYSGWVVMRTGTAPSGRADLEGPSFDTKVSDLIGNTTRFRSIQMTATGKPQDSYSFRNANAVNPPEISPAEFYQRIFGTDFQDPNSSNFKPDPRIMARKSVLSAVLDDSKGLAKTLGAEDRQRLDQYFTSVREMEKRLALQLEKPAPALACSKPKEGPPNILPGMETDLVEQRHNLMVDILVSALACNQTNVFNMMFSESQSSLSRTGYERPHHAATHEEANDKVVGYQTESSWYLRRSMKAWGYLVNALASVKEGDSTLLDRMLVLAHTDQEFARIHSLDGMPVWTAGSAGGRIKTGLHIDGNKTPITRVVYTALKTMGVVDQDWGTSSLKTNSAISEILV
jgi:Protein of unknown function (DUF1552)